MTPADRSPPERTGDPRIARSRAALLGAFGRLLLEHGYDAVSPTSIAAASGVARSTFYEHFAGKPDLLRKSLAPVLLPLAQAISADDASNPSLARVLSHFWQQRRVARLLMTGRPRLILQTQLADMLVKEMRERGHRLHVPPGLVATQIAHAHIAVLDEWLAGRHRCDAAAIERVLRSSAVALANAFRVKS